MICSPIVIAWLNANGINRSIDLSTSPPIYSSLRPDLWDRLYLFPYIWAAVPCTSTWLTSLCDRRTLQSWFDYVYLQAFHLIFSYILRVDLEITEVNLRLCTDFNEPHFCTNRNTQILHEICKLDIPLSVIC